MEKQEVTPRLRTFLLKGGLPVQFRFPNNPVIFHTGGDTLCSLFLFDEEVSTLRQTLDSCRIELLEMEAGHDLGGEEIENDPLPTCLTCFWLELNGQCGLATMDATTKREALKHPDASPAIISCTTPEIWKENNNG